MYTYAFAGCASQATLAVRVLRAEAGPDQAVCSVSAPLALVGSPAGGTWTGPAVSGSPGTGFVFTPAAAAPGLNHLLYAVTDPVSSCTSSGSRYVSVTATAPVAVTPVPPRCTTDTAPVRLQGSPAGGVWSGPGVVFSGGFYFLSPTPPAGTTTVRYTLPSAVCPQEATLVVVTSAPPVLALPADTVLCPGSSQSFRLRASPAGGDWSGQGVTGSAATGYAFTPPVGFAGTASLDYRLTTGACTATAARRVSVAPMPDGVPAWQPEACAETRLTPLSVRFRIPDNPAAPISSLIWEFGDGSQSTDPSPVHTYATPGRYQPRLRVRYNAGRCETRPALPPVEVLARVVPNVITPNGDPLNQTFRLGPDCPPRLQVFSRWGQLVFEAAVYHDEWDAAGQPAGVYYYLLTYPDGHRTKGWVEVVR